MLCWPHPDRGCADAGSSIRMRAVGAGAFRFAATDGLVCRLRLRADRALHTRTTLFKEKNNQTLCRAEHRCRLHCGRSAWSVRRVWTALSAPLSRGAVPVRTVVHRRPHRHALAPAAATRGPTSTAPTPSGRVLGDLCPSTDACSDTPVPLTHCRQCSLRSGSSLHLKTARCRRAAPHGRARPRNRCRR